MRTVLYTAIFGGSDSLKPAPAGPARCVCFTDDPTVSGPGWEIRHEVVAHARRAARLLKTSSHALFPDADLVVWADASMTITNWPRLLCDAGEAALACLPHPDRSTCYEEGAAVVRLKIAGPQRIQRALDRYRLAGFAPMRLSTTGLLVRQQTSAVAAFNELWQEHIDDFGTSDQVSIDYCAWTIGLPVTYLTGHYRENPYMRYDQQDHHRRRRPQFLPDREAVA